MLRGFSCGEFLKLQTSLSKRTGTKYEAHERCVDTTGSEKFKAPSLLASLAGMLKYKGTGKHDSKILRLHFLVKYDLLSGI